MTEPKRSNPEVPALLSNESKDALRGFAEAPTARERLLSLRRLFTARQMAAVKRQAEYAAALAWCAERASGEGDVTDDERLHALTVLVVARSGRAAVDETALTQAIERATSHTIPPLELLDDTEDQARVLAAVRELGAPWLSAYALPRTCIEAPKSNVRREAIASVLATSETFQGASEALAGALEHRGKKLAPAAFVRLTQLVLIDLLLSLQEAPRFADAQPAAGLIRLAEMLRANGIGDVSIGDAALALDALADLVRRLSSARLRLLLDPDSYEAIVIVRGALRQSWPAVSARAESVTALRDLVGEALYVQVRAGVPDAGLRRVLEALSISEMDFATRRQAIAREPGVSDTMARWLTGDEAPARDVMASVDRVNAESERDLIASLVGAVSDLDDLRFEHPDAADAPWSLVDPAVQAALALAARRRFRVAGRRGDVVPYDPLRHEVVRVPEEGVTLVRLVTPLIVEAHEDRLVVVRKALAEVFEGGAT
jgi:hypothetical protein